jgi:hypothetical protein
MKLIKQLKFFIFIFIFFTQILLTNFANANGCGVSNRTVDGNGCTVTVISPITSTANDVDPQPDGSFLGVGIYSDGKTGLIINNSSNISITSTGTVNPYGIGILSSITASSVTSITNSGIITSTTTGAATGDGNSYGITNNGQIESTIGTINNSGTIEGVSTGYGTARGINNTSGTITSIINSGNIKATATVNSGKTASYGTYNGTALYNHGDLAGVDINNKKIALIGTITNRGVIDGTRIGISNNASAAYSEANITTITNTGTISTSITSVTSSTINGEADVTMAIIVQASGENSTATLTTLNNSGTIKTVASGTGAYGILVDTRGTITTINNSGTIQAGTSAIGISETGRIGTINLNKGSVLIGDIQSNSSSSYTLNMGVGAAKSYYVSTSGTGLFTVNDLDNRPVVKGSALAINIGSMEMAGENLYQKTANITDAIDRNVKNNKDTWVEPYYSESTRDSGGDSSQIRQFKNNKQGINAGFKVENSAKPLQVIFNVDQTKNNIDSSEHIINSDGVMIGLMAPTYTQYEGYDVSVKGLVGYANSKTDRKILDNTSSTGERTLTGEYDSYYAVVGSALSKNYNLDKDLNANLTLGVDLTSEFRDSYNENLYFKYNSLELIQLQPRIQSEFIKTTGKDSNVFLTAGVGAREVLSGKTQKYSMNNTGVSFTAPNSGDYYASLAVGTNMNVAANVNFYALVSAKMSEKDTETYSASIGLKGTF